MYPKNGKKKILKFGNIYDAPDERRRLLLRVSKNKHFQSFKQCLV